MGYIGSVYYSQAYEQSATISVVNNSRVFRTESNTVSNMIEEKATMKAVVEIVCEDPIVKTNLDAYYASDPQNEAMLFSCCMFDFSKCAWDWANGGYSARRMPGGGDRWLIRLALMKTQAAGAGSQYGSMDDWGVALGEDGHMMNQFSDWTSAGLVRHVNYGRKDVRKFTYDMPHLNTLDVMNVASFIASNFYKSVSITMPNFGTVSGYIDSSQVDFTWNGPGDPDYWVGGSVTLVDTTVS